MTVSVIDMLQAAREAQGLSATEVAKRIGCGKHLVWHAENGTKFPSGKTLVRWAEVVGFQLSVVPVPHRVQPIQTENAKYDRAGT